MGKLEGKTALVTGGTSGIGRAIALRFANEGARVAIVGRNEERLREVSGQSANIIPIKDDLTEDETIGEVVEKVKRSFGGRLDILVNNAGYCPVKSILETTLEDYDRAFGLDVRSVVGLTIAALPMLVESKGCIINMSSVGATHPGRNLSLYVAAKAAVENLTKSWALDLAEIPVRVSAIAPGAIETNIWNVANLTPEESAKHKEGIASGIPVKRMGRPEEVANIALFLASDEASYVSGSVYAVDGALGAN